jgi:DNA polymerase III subunit epsilon
MRFLWLRLRNRYYLRRLGRKDVPDDVREYLNHFLRLDFDRPIAETEFVVLDAETTGFHAKKGDRILSLSAVRIKESRIDLSDTFHALVDPDRTIPGASVVIHGILPRMVDGKPRIENVLPDFLRYAGPAVLVGHHAWLDMSFLNREMVRLFGFPLQNIVIDTAILDQALALKKTQNKIKLNSTLSAVAERYNVSINGQHSSFGDALITAQIFQNMIKQVRQDGLVSLKDLLQIAFTPPAFHVQGPSVSGG